MRAIARLHPWWVRGFVLALVLAFATHLPGLRLGTPWKVEVAVLVALTVLMLVPPPNRDSAEPVTLAPPVSGRWVALNGAGTKVPSHGTRMAGQAFAIDLIHPPAESPTIGWGLKGGAPEGYSCFGDPVRAMAGGTVVATCNRMKDHRARDTWPLLMWMATGEAVLRDALGGSYLLGNHVIVDHGGTYAVYAHLRRSSVTCRVGDVVQAGDVLGEIGNTGNSSEPHLHAHLMDRPQLYAGAGLPFVWRGIDVTDELDPRFKQVKRYPKALTEMPADGQIFTATPGASIAPDA